MWLRRAFYVWLIPAAFLLPLWLLVGWGVFTAGGIAFLWTIFIAIPSVFLGELILTLLVRARGTVRATRAVSWWDVAGFTVWHALTIAVGFFNSAWFAPVLVAAILVGIGMFWLELWQLFRETRGSAVVVRTTSTGYSYIPAPEEPSVQRSQGDHEVIVINERPGTPAA